MRQKFNPADKLDLPDPPTNHYWHVYKDAWVGPVMSLRRKYSLGPVKWSTRIEYRSATSQFTDNTPCPLDLGLEHSAEVIMERISNRQAYYKEVNSLYDNGTYLDDLVTIPEAETVTAQKCTCVCHD